MTPIQESCGGEVFPGREWEKLCPSSLGWSAERLAGLPDELSTGGSTALMIVDRGRLIFHWGDVAFKSSVASVRKSLINILYGIAVAEGRIRLDATLGDLQIDDLGGLTPLERQATVADLLRARSGVYLPSVYDTAWNRPDRGTHTPGSFWFYNNWDFKVLGTIFERQTGQTVFDALAARVAGPLGMEDFVSTAGTITGGRSPAIPSTSCACPPATLPGWACFTFEVGLGRKPDRAGELGA